jgi:outer membrane protein OmpA-like peptidoglycan-associated protein
LYGLSDKKSVQSSKTFVEATNVSLLGTFNLCNLFGGYTGEPRLFEVTALGGFGWMHAYGNAPKTNFVTSKFAIDFAFNLGADKAWQLYLEPNITYALDGWSTQPSNMVSNINHGMKYDLSTALLGVNIGVTYKFLNSNGKHNFTKAQLRDQREIYDLNNKINNMRRSIETKDQQLLERDNRIEELEQALDECNKRPNKTVVVEEVKKETFLQPIVIFGQGKSTIDAAQYASIEMIAKYMRNHPESKVLIRGYASPEGNPELNQKLSVARATSVMTALINRYKIASNRITIEGMGATDSLSEEIDFNRVAMFIDTTKSK